MAKHQLLKIIDNYLTMHSNIFLAREPKNSIVGMTSVQNKNNHNSDSKIWVLDSVVPLTAV